MFFAPMRNRIIVMQLWRELGRLARQTPWYLWPFLPAGFLGVGLWLMYATVAAFASVPYSWVYPDRAAHVFDLSPAYGTARERSQLHRWRAAYGRLSFAGRVRRVFRPGGRRRRLA